MERALMGGAELAPSTPLLEHPISCSGPLGGRQVLPVSVRRYESPQVDGVGVEKPELLGPLLFDKWCRQGDVGYVETIVRGV
jgi:hypothetical protein